MVESNSIKHNPTDTSNLNNQQFRPNKISEIEDYFIAQIKEKELVSKNSANIFLFLIILINLRLVYQ